MKIKETANIAQQQKHLVEHILNEQMQVNKGKNIFVFIVRSEDNKIERENTYKYRRESEKRNKKIRPRKKKGRSNGEDKTLKHYHLIYYDSAHKTL